MNCKYLMILDWVRCSDPTPFRVQGIYNDDPWMVEDEQGMKICLGDVEPIPLTEEILVKNGFEHVVRGQFDYYDGEWEISYSIKYYGLWMENEKNNRQSIRIDIHNVHELQHIFRLFGLTELADNFKI